MKTIFMLSWGIRYERITSRMKRILSLFLILQLCFPSVLAEPSPSRSAVTIDGIRTAFFSEAGAYQQPLEENGSYMYPCFPWRRASSWM